jgi:hypothetical protein
MSSAMQMEALQQQWDNTSASIEALQQEDKRIKKHTSRLQQQTEVRGQGMRCCSCFAQLESAVKIHIYMTPACMRTCLSLWQRLHNTNLLSSGGNQHLLLGLLMSASMHRCPQELQQASQASAGNTAALQEVQQEVAALSQAQQQLQAMQDACSSSASSAGRRLQEVGQQVQQLDVRLAGQAADLTGLAESVLGCLAAARAQAAAAAEAAAQTPSSYLSTLLGPAVPPAVLGINSSGGGSKQMPWRAWVSVAAALAGCVERTPGVEWGMRRNRQQRATPCGPCLCWFWHPALGFNCCRAVGQQAWATGCMAVLS